jgi:hypothetical protein
MEMPKIYQCNVKECSYNNLDKCRAMAITVGTPTPSCELAHPKCDTFIKAALKGGQAGMVGQVGACHEECCAYNSLLACTASGINIGMHGIHADCMTFKKR